MCVCIVLMHSEKEILSVKTLFKDYTHLKTNYSIFSCQSPPDVQMGSFYGQMKQTKKKEKRKKERFSVADTQDGFIADWDKSVSTVKNTSGYLMVWAYFNARWPEYMAYADLIK